MSGDLRGHTDTPVFHRCGNGKSEKGQDLSQCPQLVDGATGIKPQASLFQAKVIWGLPLCVPPSFLPA